MASQTTAKVASQTGAAKDDLFSTSTTGLTQDSVSARLNVLDNDPGSARLYSLVQNPEAYGAGTQFPATTSAVLPSGATININADGTLGYDASAVRATLQSYAEGETFTDTFVYTIRMANGALSTAQVTVTLAGTNDAPTLAAPTPPSIFDTAAADAPSALAGALGGSDVDHGSVLAYRLADGTLAAADAYGTLSIDAATGGYSFLADAAQLNSLAAGETATASFSVLVKDEHGAHRHR
jgi:VCBS repeat-containing protein